jgi:hypothetical protein
MYLVSRSTMRSMFCLLSAAVSATVAIALATAITDPAGNQAFLAVASRNSPSLPVLGLAFALAWFLLSIALLPGIFRRRNSRESLD